MSDLARCAAVVVALIVYYYCDKTTFLSIMEFITMRQNVSENN